MPSYLHRRTPVKEDKIAIPTRCRPEKKQTLELIFEDTVDLDEREAQ